MYRSWYNHTAAIRPAINSGKCGSSQPVVKMRPNDQPGVGQRLRPEKDPGEGDEGEDQQLLDQPRNALLVKLRLLQLAGQAAAQGMQGAPDDERPRGAVPDAGDRPW